jgi:hypothetical protein
MRDLSRVAGRFARAGIHPKLPEIIESEHWAAAPGGVDDVRIRGPANAPDFQISPSSCQSDRSVLTLPPEIDAFKKGWPHPGFWSK